MDIGDTDAGDDDAKCAEQVKKCELALLPPCLALRPEDRLGQCEQDEVDTDVADALDEEQLEIRADAVARVGLGFAYTVGMGGIRETWRGRRLCGKWLSPPT